MTSDDLTVEILKQIRDGIRDMQQDFNARLDQTNARLDQTNERLDESNTRLERVEQGLLDLGKFMRQIAVDQARHERRALRREDSAARPPPLDRVGGCVLSVPG